MKIIHCADLHLDSVMTANLSGEKAKERRNELLEAFRRMVAYAVENDVQAVIIAGDLFDKKSISATACNAVRDAVVGNPGIDFYYLQGNHDADSFLARLEEVPSNLKLFGNDWTRYETGESGNIVISGMELDRQTSPERFHMLVPDAEKFNIVVLHGQESASKAKDRAEVIPFSELRNKSIDYLALGHIHSYKAEKLDGRGVYCYPGCLEGRGFDEPGEHGFVLLDINEAAGTFTYDFIKNSYRNLYVVEVDATDCMTTTEIAAKAEQMLSLRNYAPRHMLKIVLTGEVDVSCEKDTDLLTRRFSDRFYFVKVYDETKYKVNAEDYRLDESLKGEFVRNVLAADGISEEDKMAVISYGIRALAGEDIQL